MSDTSPRGPITGALRFIDILRQRQKRFIQVQLLKKRGDPSWRSLAHTYASDFTAARIYEEWKDAGKQVLVPDSSFVNSALGNALIPSGMFGELAFANPLVMLARPTSEGAVSLEGFMTYGLAENGTGVLGTDDENACFLGVYMLIHVTPEEGDPWRGIAWFTLPTDYPSTTVDALADDLSRLMGWIDPEKEPDPKSVEYGTARAAHQVIHLLHLICAGDYALDHIPPSTVARLAGVKQPKGSRKPAKPPFMVDRLAVYEEPEE